MTIRHALVVDDSKSARMMLQRLLSKMNVEADAVESAEEALQFLEHHQPDVIFMDHMMPGMDGLAATQLIKSNPRTAAIPTIMYTSKEGEEYQHMARSHGAHGVLAKPASHEAIMAVIESLDAPAANDEPTPAQQPIPLIEVDKLVQKHLKTAIAEARAEISAGLDGITQQLQSTQTQQIDLSQARLFQQYERWKNEVEKNLSADALYQKTRLQNQRLAIGVADKLIKKSADDLVTVMQTNRSAADASLATLRAELMAEQKKAIAAASRRAMLVATLAGAAIGGLIGILATFLPG